MNRCLFETVNACIMALIRRSSVAINVCVVRVSKALPAASALHIATYSSLACCVDAAFSLSVSCMKGSQGHTVVGSHDT